MAFYRGETLAARLESQPGHRLPATEAAAIAGQLASALAAAHAAGVVHRDLKPDNVMILPDGRVKLLDFGLAKWVDSPTVTEKGFAVGTAAYMAPEQFHGEESGTASDLWALGAVLYEMLAGERPFGGEKKGMVHAILHEDPPALRGLRPDVPEALEAIATRSLAKKPEERYPDAASVLAELAAAGLWSSGSSGSAPFATRRRGRSRWPGLAVAVFLLAAVGTAAFFLLRKPKPLVYVAVLKPEVSGSLLADDAAQVRSNLQVALVRAVAALEGLAALDTGQVNAVQGTPTQIAHAMAAGEVVASQADCAGDLCQVSLRRLDGQDGRVLWSDTLRVPSLRSPPLRQRHGCLATAGLSRTGPAGAAAGGSRSTSRTIGPSWRCANSSPTLRPTTASSPGSASCGNGLRAFSTPSCSKPRWPGGCTSTVVSSATWTAALPSPSKPTSWPRPTPGRSRLSFLSTSMPDASKRQRKPWRSWKRPIPPAAFFAADSSLSDAATPKRR